MPQISIRASEDLVEAIDNDKAPEASRSKYVREAVRQRLRSASPLEHVERRCDELDERLGDLEDRLEEYDARLEDVESDDGGLL